MDNKLYEEKTGIEIDLMELLFVYSKNAWLIILAAVIGCLGSGLFSKFIIKPEYTSTSMVYVLSKETTLTSLADLQIGSQLTKDYSVMITSRPVLMQVIEKLNLELSYEELKGVVKVSNPADTRILNMSVTDPNPKRAKAIVDEVAKASSDYIGDIMEMIPPKIIEEGVVSDQPSSPNVKRNAAMGGIIMVLLALIFLSARVILNDTIRSEDDVVRYLGISVLAAIPDDSEITDKNSKDGNRGKAAGKDKKDIVKNRRRGEIWKRL